MASELKPLRFGAAAAAVAAAARLSRVDLLPRIVRDFLDLGKRAL